mgnify:CR=1 FL=1
MTQQLFKPENLPTQKSGQKKYLTPDWVLALALLSSLSGCASFSGVNPFAQLKLPAALASNESSEASFALLQDTTTTESIVKPSSVQLQNWLGFKDAQLNQLMTALNASSGETKLTTPQSVNIDFQTGIMANTVAFANVRWVDWSKFKVQPYQFGKLSQYLGQNNLIPNKPNGFNLIDYKEDQISATVGVGRKFNERWGGNVSVGWDSGAGNPVTTLGPTEGFWSVGTGVRFSPAENYFIGAGVKYFWLGDADAVTGAHSNAGKFTNNDAIAYGLNLGYKF